MKGWGRPMFEVITGYVYFIQMGDVGPIKIGFTKDVGKRILALQTSIPYPLKLLCFFPGNEAMERNIHSCLVEIRLDGEWFLPHPLLLREIEGEKYTNKLENFYEANPENDLGDWTLGGSKWDDPKVIEDNYIREFIKTNERNFREEERT